MTIAYNRFGEKSTRRRLRRDMPNAEVILWSKLKGRQISGCKFRRQHSVGPYVLDYYCPEAKLAIEVDGPTHGGSEIEIRDGRRQEYVESFGIRFLRVTNDDVYHALEGVLAAIQDALVERFGPECIVGERGRNRHSDPPKSPLGKGGL